MNVFVLVHGYPLHLLSQNTQSLATLLCLHHYQEAISDIRLHPFLLHFNLLSSPKQHCILSDL